MTTVNRIKFFTIVLTAASALLLNACRQIELYEKNTAIPKFAWERNFPAKGEFMITDTTSAYSIYIVLRHTDAYQYNNIWLNVGLQPPGDTMHFQKVNLKLGDDANGWEGTGMNDIWELRKLVNGEPRRFKKAGKYSFVITQIMRDNPLQQVISAGLRLEKK